MKTALLFNGYFSSRSDTATTVAAEKAFLHVKEQIIDKLNGEVDIFIHSWDIENEKKIKKTYGEWIKVIKVEKQKDFSRELSLMDEDWYNKGFEREKTMYKECKLEIILSYLYSRKEAVKIKKQFEKKNGFLYDAVFLGRFDLGTRGKEYYQPAGCYPTDVIFNPSASMEQVYTPFWYQFNAGYADHWWYSNSNNIDLISTWYDKCFEYFKKESDYSSALESGWFDSNAFDEFSNEALKPISERSSNLVKYPRWMAISTHHCAKWFMKDVGLYYKTSSILKNDFKIGNP